MADEQIADDEWVYRRIPPTEIYFQPPDRLTSANFKLRRDENGLSVNRASIVSAAAILALPSSIPGSRVAVARVSDIRRLTSGSGQPLNLDVIIVEVDGIPGHAEIIGIRTDAAAKALCKLFQVGFPVEIPTNEDPT